MAPQGNPKEQHRAFHKIQLDDESLERECDLVSSKVFNFYSIRLVLATKLKKHSEKPICKYKIDTGSDSNLMPLSIFRSLYLNTTITELNKCINKKIIVNTHNNSCIPQLGIQSI